MQIETYNRADSLSFWGTLASWALAIVVGVLVVLCCIAIGSGLHTRRRRRQFKLHMRGQHVDAYVVDSTKVVISKRGHEKILGLKIPKEEPK